MITHDDALRAAEQIVRQCCFDALHWARRSAYARTEGERSEARTNWNRAIRARANAENDLRQIVEAIEEANALGRKPRLVVAS